MAAVEVAVPKLREETLADGVAVAQRHRKGHCQAVIARCNIRAPSDPGENIAALHQKTVAEVVRGHGCVHVGVRRGVLHAPERDLVSPIVDLEEQGPACPREIDGLEDHRVRGKLNSAAAVPVSRSYAPAAPNGCPPATSSAGCSSRRTRRASALAEARTALSSASARIPCIRCIYGGQSGSGRGRI